MVKKGLLRLDGRTNQEKQKNRSGWSLHKQKILRGGTFRKQKSVFFFVQHKFLFPEARIIKNIVFLGHKNAKKNVFYHIKTLLKPY